MIKRILINLVLPSVITAVIEALQRLAMKSDNQIDDRIVEEISINKDRLIAEIKANL